MPRERHHHGQLARGIEEKLRGVYFGESPHLEDGAEATRHARRKSMWNKSEVAQLLGISHRKIDKFGIVPEL